MDTKYILSWQVNGQGENVAPGFTKGRPQTLEGVKKSLAGFLGWNAEKSSDPLDKAVSKLLTTGFIHDIQAADWVPCYQRPLKYSFLLEPWDGSQEYILTFEGQNHTLPFERFTGTLEQAIEQAERSVAEYQAGEPAGSVIRWSVKECQLTEYGPIWETVVSSADPEITGRRGGKKGGAARSAKKAAAAAANGAKGGRPRKVQEVCKCEKCGASTGIDANAKLCFSCEVEAKREAIERKEAAEAEDREWMTEYNSPAGKAYRKEQKKLGKK